MSVALDAARLRIELVRRGMSAADLARAARLSHATVGAALAGRGVAPATLGLIAKALLATPALALIDELVAPDPTGRPGKVTAEARMLRDRRVACRVEPDGDEARDLGT